MLLYIQLVVSVLSSLNACLYRRVARKRRCTQ